MTTVHIAGLPESTSSFVMASDDFEVRCAYAAGEFDCEGTTESGVHGSIQELWFYAPFTSAEIELVAKDAAGNVLTRVLETPEAKVDDDCGKESKSASVSFEIDVGGAGGAAGSAGMSGDA